MTKTLPVPIQFELPGPAWHPTQPESVGVQNAAFLAVREPFGSTPYRPTLTISGDWRTDDATIDQIADESVVKVQQEAGNARLVQRTSVGSDEAPAVTQLISARATIEGVDYDLRQVQVGRRLPGRRRPDPTDRGDLHTVVHRGPAGAGRPRVPDLHGLGTRGARRRG